MSVLTPADGLSCVLIYVSYLVLIKDKTVTVKKKFSGQMSHIWARHQDILTD
jgi:hypothetical protein